MTDVSSMRLTVVLDLGRTGPVVPSITDPDRRIKVERVEVDMDLTDDVPATTLFAWGNPTGGRRGSSRPTLDGTTGQVSDEQRSAWIDEACSAAEAKLGTRLPACE